MLAKGRDGGTSSMLAKGKDRGTSSMLAKEKDGGSRRTTVWLVIGR